MHIEALVKILNGKPSNKGYIACCPAHDDKNPSLSINEDNGKILLKCWAGCSSESIVNAIGIEMKDLFPESYLTCVQRREYKKTKNISDLWDALNHELRVLIIIVGNRVRGEILSKDRGFTKCRQDFKQLPPEFWERELLAARRVKRMIGDIYGL